MIQSNDMFLQELPKTDNWIVKMGDKFVQIKDPESYSVPICVGDVTIHLLSGLYYICENKKTERWMSMNRYYVRVPKESVPAEYFKKTL